MTTAAELDIFTPRERFRHFHRLLRIIRKTKDGSILQGSIEKRHTDTFRSALHALFYTGRAALGWTEGALKAPDRKVAIRLLINAFDHRRRHQVYPFTKFPYWKPHLAILTRELNGEIKHDPELLDRMLPDLSVPSQVVRMPQDLKDRIARELDASGAREEEFDAPDHEFADYQDEGFYMDASE
jgi:hypothetical protein